MSYVLTSDWHIRYDKPICRNDDFLDIQKRTLEQIRDIVLEKKAVLIIAGDIFDKARPDNPQELEIMLIDIFKDIQVFFIGGNHDLLYGRLENLDKTSLGVLSRQFNWSLLNSEDLENKLKGFSYGEKIKNFDNNITVLHKYCEKNKLPPYIGNGIMAKFLCEKYNSSIFVTGDNHHKFVYENSKTKQTVINPGCITRQTVDMKNYKPSVFHFNSDLKIIKQIDLLDNAPNVIDDSHIRIKQERDERIDNFINKLDNKGIMDIDFKNNLKKYLRSNRINTKIKNKVLEIVDG